MTISVASRKAKGRRLQDWVRDQLYLRFPSLEEGDIRGAIMGETGADVKLSPLASKQIPVKIECKARESYKGIYDSYTSYKDEQREATYNSRRRLLFRLH